MKKKGPPRVIFLPCVCGCGKRLPVRPGERARCLTSIEKRHEAAMTTYAGLYGGKR